jgi:hypothetical protein
MELRCAQDDALTAWGPPEFVFPIYYYKALPYDPVRPWKDRNGLWYSSWSSDGCNGTNKAVEAGSTTEKCLRGGQLELLVSPALHGPKANWKPLPPMFTTNVTKSGALTALGTISSQFVTTDYFGGLPGDPDGGQTRVVTQNSHASTFWAGRQENGGKFEPFWGKTGAVGWYDYGVLTMARTLGSASPNQVAVNGRRVLVGWIGTNGGNDAQSLARDLTLSPQHELLQQFVPELQKLRMSTPTSDNAIHAAAAHGNSSLQMEILAKFRWTNASLPPRVFGVTLLSGAGKIVVDCTAKDPSAPNGCMMSVPQEGSATRLSAMRTQPFAGPLMPLGASYASIPPRNPEPWILNSLSGV